MSCCRACSCCSVAESPRVCLDSVIDTVAVCIVDDGFSGVPDSIIIRVPIRDLCIHIDRLSNRGDWWTSHGLAVRCAAACGASVACGGSVIGSYYRVESGIEDSVGVVVNIAYRARCAYGADAEICSSVSIEQEGTSRWRRSG